MSGAGLCLTMPCTSHNWPWYVFLFRLNARPHHMLVPPYVIRALRADGTREKRFCQPSFRGHLEM